MSKMELVELGVVVILIGICMIRATLSGLRADDTVRPSPLTLEQYERYGERTTSRPSAPGGGAQNHGSRSHPMWDGWLDG